MVRAQALSTLEKCVKERWKVLPADQREAIKAYIVNVIVRCAPRVELSVRRACRC
jgi:hypothetical protein